MRSEQRGRRVLRTIAGYGIVAFALLQIVEPIMHGLHLPEATLTYFLVGLALAFPIVVIVSWMFDVLRLGARAAAPAAGHPAALPVREPLATPASLLAIVLVAAAVSAIITLLAAGRETAGKSPTLAQVTLARGVAEYPAWSPDGKQILYVAQGGAARKIFLKDLASGRDSQLTSGDSDDLQPEWSPDGQKIVFVRARQPGRRLEPGDVFGRYDDADVWQIDLRTKKESWLLREAFDPAYSPDGSRIAVDTSWAGPRRIWVVDARGQNPQQITTDSSEAVEHLSPRWSPDGKKIAFQSQEGRTKLDVRVFNLETKELGWITNDFATDVHPVWSRSGGFIYFSSDRSGGMNVWRAPVRSDGTLSGPLQQITNGAGQDVEVATAPDGKRLAFATRRQNADIWRLPVSPETGAPAGQPEPLISTTREDSRGAWSPDGRLVAFNSDRSGDMNIWLHSLGDGGLRQLTSGSGGDFQPQWSPDGSTIAFFSSRSGTPHIWSVEVASGKLTALTSSPSRDVSPFFSPDGKRIAFQSDRSGRAELWVMNADGSGPRQLTNLGVGGHFLRWTKAGNAIVFRCTCAGRPATMIVPADGGEPAPFTEQKGGSHISFSPDESRIMDVVGHKVLWASPVRGGEPLKVFEFTDANARIDYPVWSPDGRWVLFDRAYPQGGDIWVMKDIE